MAVRQVAAIHFKNFIAKNWAPLDPSINFLINTFFFFLSFAIFIFMFMNMNIYLFLITVDEQQKISQSDKDMVRDHILVFVAQVPPLLRYNNLVSLFFFFV